MADFITKNLYRLRFLLVGAIVMALFSAPFMTSAGQQKASLIQITDLNDTIAGLSTEISLEGEPYQAIEVSVTKPSGKQLLLESVTDASGEADISLSAYHLREAGTYIVEARHLTYNEAYGRTKSFEVQAGSVSASRSTIELSQNSAKVGDTVEMNITLKDEYGNPIDGHILQVASSKNILSSYSPDRTTDEEGEMQFYLLGERKGITDLRVFDKSANKEINTDTKLAFLSGSDMPSDTGGWSNSYSSVLLAAESGPVDSFILDMDATADPGDELTVTVTAVDEDGFTVSDYTGEIRFSSSDQEAELPNDYTFEADDLGEHTFSLGVQFITPGTQSLTVTDIDQTSVKGEAEIEISSSSDFGSDFETEDFQREGDFTLISPASGSYSETEIEVQGEADFGYFAVIYVNDEEAARTEIDFDNSFTYTLEDLEDDTYEIYVDIVDLDDSVDPEDAEILEVIETSDLETIVIDTTAPELIKISTDPADEAEPGEIVTVTVLSEENLEEASILFEEEIYELTETSTGGKYTTEIPMPEDEGDYSMDVILLDTLGNEVQYRDQLTISVLTGSSDTTDTTADTTDTTDTSTSELTAVSGLTVTGDSESVLLSWEAADGAVEFYRIYYGPSADTLFAVEETLDSSTSWAITDLPGEEIYYFAIAGVDTDGNEGDLSDAVIGIPLAKVVSTSDYIPAEEVPAITTATPPATPESGAGATALMLLSALGSAGYLGARRKK